MKYEQLTLIKNPKSQTAEAYRTLRTNIQFSSLDQCIKTIVITSSQSGEGKSTVAANLAIAMSQSGMNVLIIDCDLRKPTLHRKFGLVNQIGLTSILLEKKKLQDCIKTINLPNLFIITSGPVPPNPAELLGTRSMKSLLAQLKDTFDVVLIDAPPVLAVTDAQVLGALCDRVMLVASYGEADKKDIIRAKELFDKVGAKIIGVVINKVPDLAQKHYSYYEADS